MAVLLLPLPFFAQHPAPRVAFTHLTTEDGLSHSRVRSFFQDSKGFIWIGTEGGLNRYDANNFTVFKHFPNSSGSIINHSIPAILEDSRHNFWVGTKEGLQLLDPRKNIFFPGRGDDKNPLKEIGAVLTLFEDSDSNVWVGTTAGLFRLTLKMSAPFSPETLREASENGRFQVMRFHHNPQDNRSLSHKQVWSIGEDQSGIVWIGTGGGLNRFDPATNTIERWPAEKIKNAAALSSATVNALVADHSGYLWVGTSNGLYRLSPGRTAAQVFMAENGFFNGPGDNFITEMIEDRWGNVWIGSDGGGLDRWNPQTGTFVHHRHDPNDPESLSDNNIEALYEDRNGGLWIGNHKGISYLNHHQKPFQYFRNKGLANSLTPGTVTCFCERPDGDVWIGIDDGGMDLFNRKTGDFTHFRHRPGNAQSICDDDVVAVLEDSRGDVWIGTWGGGLTRFRPNVSGGSGGSYSHYLPDGRRGSIGDNDIWTIYEDRKGEIWIGTVDDGLNRYDRASDTFQSFRWEVKDQSDLFRNWALDIYEDHRGNIWVATTTGLNRLMREPAGFVHYTVEGQGKMDRIYAIQPHPAGGFWLATEKGLVLFDPDKKITKRWQEQDGLADNLVNSIEADRQGILWLGTGKGISKFDPATGQFRNYDARDGLQSGGFSGASLKSDSGEMFFGGINGFNVFHPDSIKGNPDVPTVVITDFRLFNLSVPVQGSSGDTLAFSSPLKQPIFNTGEIRLRHWQDDITFEFAALNYLSPEKNKYRFQLKGYDDGWIEATAGRNFAHYTSLSPGTYIFRVIGSNNDGVWNEQGATVKIIISPPWWNTWWAYLLYAIILGSLFYFIRRYELHRQRLKQNMELEHREAEQLKELDKTKSRLYANITHEFRTPLTVILGVTEQLEKEIGKENSITSPGLALIHRNGSRLLTLVNQMLDLSKLESNRMEVQLIQADIAAYVNYITESFHSLAEAKHLSIRVSSDPASIVMDYDPGKILQIVSNLLSNAIKFTPPGGEIEVRLTVDGGRFTVDGPRWTVDGSLSTVDGPVDLSTVYPPPSTVYRQPCTVHRGPCTVYRLPSTVLTVRDTGIGIPPDQLPHIFDRFYQADNSSTRKGEGTGIGLALVQELVKLFKGQIRVESMPGKGTTFTVQLPIRREAPVETSDAVLASLPSVPHLPGYSGESAASGDETWPLLLIIEDNPDVQTYLIRCLERKFRIETASNGHIGIGKAFELIPDIIISDVMMPEKDGFEVCDALKKDVRTSHIPIVLLTARAT
ncbi:MAG TPA: two-component regulator propeller domain-containing protein, partial [Saprospiraceae bacterium]|nr:two-component regulator propeller domain-containing protein [Saprospiraceae bacterium]